MSTLEKNKKNVVETLKDFAEKAESMSPECFKDYKIYLSWKNTRNQVDTIKRYSGEGSPGGGVPFPDPD